MASIIWNSFLTEWTFLPHNLIPFTSKHVDGEGKKKIESQTNFPDKLDVPIKSNFKNDFISKSISNFSDTHPTRTDTFLTFCMFDATSSDYFNDSSSLDDSQSNQDISSTVSYETVRLVSREGDGFELSAVWNSRNYPQHFVKNISGSRSISFAFYGRSFERNSSG